MSNIMELKLKTVLGSPSRKSKSAQERSLPKGVIDALLSEKTTKLAEMEKRIETLQEMNMEKDGKIARRDAALRSKVMELAGRDARIRELEAMVASPMELLMQVRDTRERAKLLASLFYATWH